MNKLNSQDRILIDKFLLGQLTEEERALYDERNSDPLFEQELAFRSELIKVSEQKGNKKLRNLLEEESKRIDDEKPKKKTNLNWIIIALLSIAGLYYFLAIHDSSPSNEEIFIAQYEVFPNLVAPTSRSNGVDLIGAQLALYEYDRGNFEKTIAVLDTLSEMENDLMIYHAIANIEIGKIDRAKNLLIRISNNNLSQYREASEWYLCLLYLKEGDVQKYNEQLKSISSRKEHLYYAKSLKLKHTID